MNLSRLEERITALCKLKRYNEALVAAERALELAREALGPNHPSLSAYQNNISSIRKMISLPVQNLINSDESVKPDTVSWLQRLKLSSFIKAAAVLVAFVFVSAGFADKLPARVNRDSNPAYEYDSPKTEFTPFYRVKASFYPDTCSIEGEEEITFSNSQDQSELVLNLYFNRYNNDSLKSSEMRRYAFKQGVKKGYIDILQVTVKGESVPFKQNGEILRVGPQKDLFPQGMNSVKISFRIKIPYISDRSGGNSDGVWLGNWLPTLSADAVRYTPTEIGDPFVNISSTYETEFTVPREYSLVLSNTYSIEDKGNSRVYKSRLERIRDLPIFLNRSYKHASVKEGEIQIHYYYRSASRPPGEVLDATRKSLVFFRDYVGEYPWKQLNIVENDMYLNGMEYSTLLLLSSKAIKSGPEEIIFHEVGHQWFYNIIGSDQYNAAFIDEGLVEFLSSYILKRKMPQFHDQIVGLNKSLTEFGSWPKYREIHYQNGRKLFESIYVLLGKTEFENFIKEYYDKYEFSIVTSGEFREFLEEKIGKRATQKLLQ